MIRFVWIAVICLAVVAGYSGHSSAQAAAPGTTVITATVRPVRYILVNGQGTIREIQSNTPANVTPVVYRMSYDTAPVALTPAIQYQYSRVISRIDMRRTGVVYRLNTTVAKTPPALSWLHAASYRSRYSRS